MFICVLLIRDIQLFPLPCIHARENVCQKTYATHLGNNYIYRKNSSRLLPRSNLDLCNNVAACKIIQYLENLQ